MAILHVRNVPDDLYHSYNNARIPNNRSLSAEVARPASSKRWQSHVPTTAVYADLFRSHRGGNARR